MIETAQAKAAQYLAARHLGIDGDQVESIVVSPEEGTDYWKVEVSIGYADLLIADLLVSEDIALGIAHAIDIVYGCGVYVDGELMAAGQHITHGRHCTCSSCARADWASADLAPCGMHGSDCPALYQPWGPAGSYHQPVIDQPDAR